MVLAYKVTVIHLKDGGRLPLLFQGGSPFPVSLVCRYVMKMLWSRNLKTNSILLALRSLKEIYEWAAGLASSLKVH